MTPEEIEALKQEKEKLTAKNAELLAEKKAAQDKLDAAEKIRKEKEEADLIAAKNFEELAKSKDAELKALKEANEANAKLRIDDAKKSNLNIELSKLGMIPERAVVVLGQANLQAIQFDEPSKTIYGAEAEARRLQSLMPELFGRDKTRIADDAPKNDLPKEMSIEWYNSLNDADRKKHYKAFMKHHGH